MSTTPDEHKHDAPDSVRCAVITVSDTRTVETDTGGALICEKLEQSGHSVQFRKIVPDEPARISQTLDQLEADQDVDVILFTGGTGISRRDQTYETISARLSKVIPGYGELFRMLSFQEIGPAAMLSRTTGGLFADKVLLTMPGSRAAVRLAMEQVILPELGHLVRESRR